VLRWLTDPYQTDFMRNAAAVAVLIGVLAPTIGVWVVLRRLAYLGDAMSHATLGGVAGAYLLGVSITLGALAAGVVMGVLVTQLERHRRIAQDAAIGVAESLLFALGIVLISRSDRIGVDLSHYLFGQIVTVTRHDLLVSAGLTAGALVVVLVLFDDLRAITFDAAHARQVGVRVDAVHLALMTLISVTVVVSLDTVGLLMSIAMIVTPAAAARMVTNRARTMTLVAIGIGVSSALLGLTLAYHLATPPGPTIALCTVAWFALVAVGAARQRRAHTPLSPRQEPADHVACL
jgi:ABC-type Mn2+/Zn2+ transport system permease subunit